MIRRPASVCPNNAFGHLWSCWKGWDGEKYRKRWSLWTCCWCSFVDIARP